jgi:hypothetical protein
MPLLFPIARGDAAILIGNLSGTDFHLATITLPFTCVAEGVVACPYLPTDLPKIHVTRGHQSAASGFGPSWSPIGRSSHFSRGNWLLTDSPGAEQLLQQLLEVGTLPQRIEVAVLLHAGAGRCRDCFQSDHVEGAVLLHASGILESLSHRVAEQLHRLVAVKLHRRLPLPDVFPVKVRSKPEHIP